MKILKLTFALFATAAVFFACENEEEAAPKVGFSAVNSILAASCQPCHVAGSGANFDSRAKFVNDYNIAKNVAGGILNRISRNPGEQGFMPINSDMKLSAANIQTIQDWIDGGFAEN